MRAAREGARIAVAAVVLLVVVAGLIFVTHHHNAPKPDAGQVAQKLAAAGLPLSVTVVYTAASDPNALLGRPGQYVGKLAFADSRIKGETGDFDAIARGGSIETFDNGSDARRRYDYARTIASQVTILNEYDYLSGTVLLRVSSKLTPDQAAQYEDALPAAVG